MVRPSVLVSVGQPVPEKPTLVPDMSLCGVDDVNFTHTPEFIGAVLSSTMALR